MKHGHDYGGSHCPSTASSRACGRTSCTSANLHLLGTVSRSCLARSCTRCPSVGHHGSIFALAARRPPSEGITLRCLIGIPAVHHPINRSAGVVFTSALFTCAIRPRPLPTAVGREQQIAQRTGPGARLLPAFLLTLVILQGIHLNPANECDALVAFNLPLGSFGKVDSAHACCSAAVSQKLSAKPQD